MDKFYAQCGPIRMVMNAWDADSAAMAVVNEALKSHLWIYDAPEIPNHTRKHHLMIEALLHLDSVVLVSRRGFDRTDSLAFEVPELIQLWHRLMASLKSVVGESNFNDFPMQGLLKPR